MAQRNFARRADASEGGTVGDGEGGGFGALEMDGKFSGLAGVLSINCLRPPTGSFAMHSGDSKAFGLMSISLLGSFRESRQVFHRPSLGRM